MMKRMKASSLLAIAALPLLNATAAYAADEVNVYSYRQPFLIQPMLDAFTQETGIKVNVKFAKAGIAEQLVREGEFSPADVLLTVDISRLAELVAKGVVQPVTSLRLKITSQLTTATKTTNGLH